MGIDISALHPYLDSLDDVAADRVIQAQNWCAGGGLEPTRNVPRAVAWPNVGCLVQHANGAWESDDGPWSAFDRLCFADGVAPVVAAIKAYFGQRNKVELPTEAEHANR